MCRPDDFPPYEDNINNISKEIQDDFFDRSFDMMVRTIHPEPPRESISFTHPDKVMLNAQLGGFFCEFLIKYNRAMGFSNLSANTADGRNVAKLIDEQVARLIHIMEGKEGF